MLQGNKLVKEYLEVVQSSFWRQSKLDQTEV